MNKMWILNIAVVLVIGCGNHKNDPGEGVKTIPNYPASVNERVSNLFRIEMKQTFLLSGNEEEIFFKSLPNSFEEFKEFYGKSYQLKDGRNLYLSYDLHFGSLLPNLYYIENKEVLMKLITISIGSRWDSDHIAVLQRCIQYKFGLKVKTACEIMGNFSSEDIIGFWRFYFDGPHPDNYQNDFEELYRRYRTENAQVAELMKKAYEELLLESDRHGH